MSRSSDRSNVATAVIGGTGLNEWQAGQSVGALATPFGPMSQRALQCSVGDSEVFFLARHGSPHQLAPHEINYRANLWGLKQLGVKHILAVNAVGAIRQDLLPGALVLPDQLIDYTYGREHSYAVGGGSVEGASVPAHIDFSYPFSAPLRDKLIHSAAVAKLELATTAVYGVTQGPRLETAAEINRMERDGCDIVGMTAMPEAALARELGMDYVSICLVVNPAAGRSETLISLADIEKVVATAMVKVRTLLASVIPAL